MQTDPPPLAAAPRSKAAQLRWALNFLLPLLLPLVGSLPEATGIGRSIAEVSNAHVTPVTPAGYAFAIWLPIFALAIAWGIWQALPAGRAMPLAHRLGWPLALCYALNILWMLLTELTGMGWHLVVVILAALACALIAFVNVAAAAHATGLIAEGAAGSFTAVLLLLAAGGFATAIVALVRDAVWYLAAVAWALVGIILANAGFRDVDLAPAIAAGAMLALVVAVHVMRRQRP